MALSWQADIGANGYNVWYVESKQDIDSARENSQPPAMGVAGCATPSPAVAPTCTDSSAVPRLPTLFHYQVRVHCAVGSEGP